MSEKTLIAYQSKDKPASPILKMIEANYQVYHLIPDRFIQDGKIIEEILTSISALVDFNIQIKDKSIVYKPTYPIFYELFYKNHVLNFYYVIPEIYEEILVNKIKTTFKTATFRKVSDYFTDFENSYYCDFVQSKHYMFSLNVDYRINGLIENLISIVNNMRADDNVLFQIGIKPLNDSWRNGWKNAYKKYKDGNELKRSNDVVGIVLDKVFDFAEGTLSVLDMVLGQKIDKKKEELDLGNTNDNYRYHNMTKQKVTMNGFQLQLRLYCDSDKIYYYGKLFDGILRVLDADQEMHMGRIKKFKDIERKLDFQFQKNIYSQKELGMFLQMPNRRMQVEYKKQMSSVQTRETELPSKLLGNEGILIGEYKYKGETFNVYFPSDKDNAYYSLLLSGFQRTGKTSYIVNHCISAVTKGHSAFVIDTIKNCDLSNLIRDYMPKEYAHKLIVLDFSQIEKGIIPLAWNELDLDSGTQLQRMLKASTLAGSFESFLDTVYASDEGEKLSPKMKRYLSSACKLVLLHSDSTINDIILCLTDYQKRHEFIDKSKLPLTAKVVQDMLQLDGQNETTKYNEISGIIDRTSMLMNDMYMELFLSADINKAINFQYWADNGYCVLLKIPELNFSTVAINSVVTFLFSKIWLSIISRKDNDNVSPCHIYFDEIHKFSQVNKLMTSPIREAAKYKTNFIISAHSLTDLKSLLPLFKAAGSHYMLFKSSTNNYKLLEKELFPFEMDDLMDIKPFHTINIINHDRDYTVFMSKTPLAVDYDKSKKNFHRDHLDEQCLEQYGVKIDIN